MRADDAEDLVDPSKDLPLSAMGSKITFSSSEIETYYSVRVPKLKLRRTSHSRGPCPIHGGNDNNFAVKIETGDWFCHSQCGRGGDIIALETALTGRDFLTCKTEVFRIVGRALEPHRSGTQPTSQASPRATACRERRILAQSGFHHVADYQYGMTLRKARFEHESNQQQGKDRPEKTFRWEHLVNGIWYSGDGGLPKPLYVNDVFRETDQAGFAVGLEGEAKADVAGELGFPAFSFKNITPEQVATLVECDVVLWPDKDESGAEQAESAARNIHDAGGIRSIKMLAPPSELSVAGDIVDAVRTLGWDNALVSQFLKTAADYQAGQPAHLGKTANVSAASATEGLTQSQLLIELAGKATLFHTPDGDAYAGLPVGDHRKNWLVKSKSCRRWLTRAFYEAIGKPPGAQAMQDALGVLEAKAQFDSPASQVFTRVAPLGDSIYIDLCNDGWEAVEITATCWRVVPSPPVRFRRSKGMQPLPIPVQGGSVARLRSLINVGDDKNWILLVSWLIAACRPRGPYPLLILQGEQGSAKSTTARLLRKIIDPVTAPLRTPPREERDLLIAANNSWVVAYDNISDIPQWLSDALCRLATGGGFSTRELYTDTEEVILDLTRQ